MVDIFSVPHKNAINWSKIDLLQAIATLKM
jgi:hypothetical protein